MKKTSLKEREAVLRLDGPARYQHFVKRVVDSEAAWGLWSNGWALMADESGSQVFPLWPTHEYAHASRIGGWSEYEPKRIALNELLEVLLPELIAKNVLPGVFPTPEGQGVTPTVEELIAALRKEMEKYGE